MTNPVNKFAALNKLFADIEQELVPPELRVKGWRYVDFPTRFSYEMWDYLLRLIGEGEYQLLAYTEAVDTDGPYKRGQFVISPQGMLNMQDKSRRESDES